MARKVKTIGPSVITNPGRKPLVAALVKIQKARSGSFPKVEGTYLAAMERFDALVAAGQTTQGDRQNGKGDFFNDVLATLLEKGTRKQLHTRPGIPGLLFPHHALDVAYPQTGTVQLTIETKATGIPKHPGSTKQKVSGRAGSADLEKRIKEAAFKDIDIKGEYARALGKGKGATSDLRGWLRRTPPRNWLFLSARVRDQPDLDATIGFAHIAANWFDGCGLYAYGHENWDLSKPYERKSVPTTVELDRVFAGLIDALSHLK